MGELSKAFIGFVAAAALVACSTSDTTKANPGSSPSTATSSEPSTGSSPSKPAPGPKPLQLVALGDSIIYGSECAGCALFVDQFAKAWSTATGREVEVRNLAVPGAGVSQLLASVKAAQSLRHALSNADGVVVTIGINDLPYNRLDDPCHVASQYPVVKWKNITTACTDRVTSQYRRDLDAVLTEINGLRHGRLTLLRVTTVYNSVIGDQVDPSWDSPEAVAPSVYATQQYAQAQCDVTRDHRGECADTYHALNGKSGRQAAGSFLGPDYTHLSQVGHDAFAKSLIATGFER